MPSDGEQTPSFLCVTLMLTCQEEDVLHQRGHDSQLRFQGLGLRYERPQVLGVIIVTGKAKAAIPFAAVKASGQVLHCESENVCRTQAQHRQGLDVAKLHRLCCCCCTSSSNLFSIFPSSWQQLCVN